MSQPTITIHYCKHPIRVYGLPDSPTFNEQDLKAILSIETLLAESILIPDLEVKITKQARQLNLAGVFRLIFNSPDEPTAQNLEAFFVMDVIPALRKYGLPAPARK